MKNGSLLSNGRDWNEAAGALLYMLETSDCGRGQMMLNGLGKAADARRALMEAFQNYIEDLADARALELIRYAIEHPPAARPARPVRRAFPLAALQPEDSKLEPFFRNKQKEAEIRRALPANQRQKWARYYKKFGCLICRSKAKPHSSCGMCSRCRTRVAARLREIAKP